MKKIYILLTATNSIVSKGIRLYTRKQFSHVSIALDDGLNKLYSFARINPYFILPGGFVHESVKYGTFKRFKKTRAMLYSLEIEDEKYNEIEKTIYNFERHRKEYSYNVIGLFLAAAKIRYKRNKKMYCTEFVEYVLKKANVEIGLESLMKPEDFEKIGNLELEYEGELNKYSTTKKERWLQMAG